MTPRLSLLARLRRWLRGGRVVVEIWGTGSEREELRFFEPRESALTCHRCGNLYLSRPGEGDRFEPLNCCRRCAANKETPNA